MRIENVFLTDESSLMVMDPDETKYFFCPPSSSKTVTTPSFNTAREGTWAGRMPKAPEKEGTSIWNELQWFKREEEGQALAW